jgi:hypothetical protein
MLICVSLPKPLYEFPVVVAGTSLTELNDIAMFPVIVVCADELEINPIIDKEPTRALVNSLFFILFICC